MGKPKVTVSIRMTEEQRAALDEIAARYDKDRSALVGEAIDNYIAEQRYYLKQIDAALVSAAKGEFVPEEQMKNFWESWHAEAAECDQLAKQLRERHPIQKEIE